MNSINTNLIDGIARIEDLPYLNSPPLQFTFSQSAPIIAGKYTFNGGRAQIGNNKNLNDNTLFYIKSLSFSADIVKGAYQESLKLTRPDITGNTTASGQNKLIDSTATFLSDNINIGDVVENTTTNEKTVVQKEVESNTEIIVADNFFLNSGDGYKIFTRKVDIPKFSLFIDSERNSPILRDPVECNDYFSNQEFKKLFLPKLFPNRITAFFRGELQQNALLAGITQVTLTMNIFGQEVTDDSFIEALKKKYMSINPASLNRGLGR